MNNFFKMNLFLIALIFTESNTLSAATGLEGRKTEDLLTETMQKCKPEFTPSKNSNAENILKQFHQKYSYYNKISNICYNNKLTIDSGNYSDDQKNKVFYNCTLDLSTLTESQVNNFNFSNSIFFRVNIIPPKNIKLKKSNSTWIDIKDIAKKAFYQNTYFLIDSSYSLTDPATICSCGISYQFPDENKTKTEVFLHSSKSEYKCNLNGPTVKFIQKVFRGTAN